MPAEGQAPLDVRPAITGVEAAKPNRRRAIIVCTVFAVVLSGIIYYLWTNHAYLKWRFIGGEVGLMDDCLETGAISLDQVITLVNSGATTDVRCAALGAIAGSSSVRIPYDDRIIEAILAFAAELPEGEAGKWSVARAIVAVVRGARQSKFMPVLKALAKDPDPEVRMCVAWALAGDADLSAGLRALVRILARDPHPAVRLAAAQALWRKDAPDWAAAILRRLLEDADAGVREAAATSAFSFRCEDGTNLFSARLREMLDLSREDESVREVALQVLFHSGSLGEDELAALAGDPQQRVAETAKRLIEWRAEEREAEREEAREGSLSDE